MKAKPFAILAARLSQHPLAISPSGFRAFADSMRVAQEIDLQFEDFFTPRAEMSVGPDGIAQVAITGVIAPGMPAIWEKLFGNTDSSTLRSELAQCAGNPNVRAILLNVDSPGGSTVGHDECRSAVQSVRAAGKPVMVFVHGEACSAAYGPSAMADFIYAAESSILGNIGSILTRMDYSAMAEEMGIKPEVYASDELKATFATDISPTTDAQAEFMQQFIQVSADRFKSAVAAARPQIAAADMNGAWFWAPDAVAKGFADFISTPQKAYGDLLSILR